MTGVSVVIPVRNGARWIGDVIASVDAQGDDHPIEVIVVDDHSTDGSRALVEGLSVASPLTVLSGTGLGMASAINLGVRAARFPIICQVDQDVVLEPGWMGALVAMLDGPDVAAVQGYFRAPPDAGLWSRVMGLDVEQRYAAIRGSDTTHVCTGNVAYRAHALHNIGLFDEQLGYGLDNDMSYRLLDAGYRLRFCRTAQSWHHWREGFLGYCRQQYGLGRGRLDVVAKHPGRVGGDAVSNTTMMLHPVLVSAGLVSLGAASAAAAVGGPSGLFATGGLAIIAALGVERTVAGLRATARFGDPAALLFPVAHLIRDVVWVGAIAAWGAQQIAGRPPRPGDSMRPRRPANTTRPIVTDTVPSPRRVMGLIPAHNEAATLPAVVTEARRFCPALDLLVVDDGSTDGTATLLPGLGVRWIRLPERMGVGSAVRAGLQFATRLGYDGVVRLDGDGKHRADDVAAVLEPLRQGHADVVMGSRYAALTAERTGPLRYFHRLLAVCLSKLTGRAVTDPTSGFCALGPRAVRLLAEHHPTGYPEPELQPLTTRNGLRVVEVPVRARPRLGGRTSLTPARIAAATARVLLAMMIVPLRAVIGDTGDTERD